MPTATLWDEDDVRASALMVEKVHLHGALAAVELWHGGHSTANLLSREEPVGVRSMPAWEDPAQCRVLDKSEIRELRRWHVDAALRARFDDRQIPVVGVRQVRVWGLQVDDERELPGLERTQMPDEEIWEVNLEAKNGSKYEVESKLLKAAPDQVS